MPAELFHTNRNLYKKTVETIRYIHYVRDSVSDPKPDPLVGGTDIAPDPDPDPSIIKQK